MHKNGISAEEAARQIDMGEYEAHFPEITDIGVNPHAVLRVYDLLEDRNKQ